MNLWQNYVLPGTLTEALEALADAPGPAVPLGGGTDLLIDLEQGRHSPVHTIVDLSSVAEMTALELRAQHVFIGAAVPLSRIAMQPLILKHAEALVEACNLIGGPQVRNVATLGGNVAHALPAADGTIALLALDASAEVAGAEGIRLMPLADLFAGPGKSALRTSRELLVGFHVPLTGKANGSCFNRIMRPQGVALPIINVALWLERRGDLIQRVRIAVGPGGPVPWRAVDAERALAGKAYSIQSSDEAEVALLAQVGFRSSPRRASRTYREHLVGDLFSTTLRSAWERAAKWQDGDAQP